jgi:hypothetical protein
VKLLELDQARIPALTVHGSTVNSAVAAEISVGLELFKQVIEGQTVRTS